jgi:microcystin-dependent protein
MSDAYIGEIRMVGFQYAPAGWCDADGQMMPVNQNAALYSLYGTLYGGDGRNTFGIPDFRGRVPIHCGQGPGLPSYPMGQSGGQPSVVLSQAEMAVHTHPADVHAMASEADQASPAGHFWAQAVRGGNAYAGQVQNADVKMNTAAIVVGENTAGGQPHQNMQPYLTVRFCVCLSGMYPPRS